MKFLLCEFCDSEQSFKTTTVSESQNDTVIRKTGQVIFFDCSGTKCRNQLSLKELFSAEKFYSYWIVLAII